MPVGEIYTRMVRCLYKKYTLRKNKDYVDEEFVSVLKSVGSLALDTLLSGNPLLKRSEVLKKVGSDAFDYGLLIGHEDFKLIRDETSDIFVTFPHRSLQEFAGSFYLILMLSEGETLESLLGDSSYRPIFMTNPLFLQFCVWFLYKSHNYFNISDRLGVCNILQRETLRRLRPFQLLLPDFLTLFPAMNVELACKNNDVLLLQYFSETLSQFNNFTQLEMKSSEIFDWVLMSLHPTLDTVKYLAVHGMVTMTYYHDNELLVTIDEQLKPDLLEKALRNFKWFRTCSSIALFDNSYTIALKQFFSLFFHEIVNNFSVYSLNQIKSYYNIDPTIVPYSPALTHLTLKNRHLNEADVEALAQAVNQGQLPSVSHLSFINCSGLYNNLRVLFKASWSELKFLNLCCSTLSSLDIKALGLCSAETNVLPKLTELVVSVDSSSLPYLFHLPSSGCKLLSPYLHVLEEENITDRSLFDILRCLTLSNIRKFGVQGTCAVINKMPSTLQSLFVQNAFDNSSKFESKICSVNICTLHHIDISHNMGVRGNMSILLSKPLSFLNSLVLKDCSMSSKDLRCLAQAQRGNKLPALKHLDVSDNELSHSHLACLFEGQCTWAQLLSLDISGNALDIIRALDSPVASGLLPVLEDVTTSGDLLQKITVRWQHLITLRLLGLYEPCLEALANARSDGRFRVLSNVCIAYPGHTTELHRNPVKIRGVSQLAEMGVSCHAFVSPDCPFAAYKCVLCHK